MITDEELLNHVQDERRASLGFDLDEELRSERETALNYSKGVMPDVPSLPNRSRAVSTDVSDTIETILPDLMEIFTGGEDVATFRPVGQEDELAAEQETDYINHVVFQENDGFMMLYSAFKDALQVKTGVFKWWWEESEAEQRQRFDDMSVVDLQNVQQTLQPGWTIEDVEVEEEEGEPKVSYTIVCPPKGRARVMAVPPEDFTVARDTVHLRETTYCAMRSRVRAQSLIADGYDADKVDELPPYGTQSDDSVEQARDTAGEHDHAVSTDLRLVEIVEHIIRVADDNELKLFRVITGADESVLLEKEEINAVPFAALTPYPVPHRFYGRSVADHVIEIQKIKTALTRMFLDSGYFALNQRYEVATDQANTFTISDLLRNEPGVPVRSKSGNAVRAIQAGSLNFPALEALEHFSTVSEARTGIVRNAQGLNPDTLHDTAKGAAALMNAAQKRVRMIARIFAETGLKDLFLGVHATVREHSSQAETVRLRGKWVQLDPTRWGQRKDMTIEVGVGSGGREHEMMVMQAIADVVKEIVSLQQGVSGPFVGVEQIHNVLKRLIERGFGMKSADLFLMDPKDAPPPGPPPPDPKMIEAQQKIQLEQQKAQAQIQLEREKATAEIQLEREKAQAEMELKREQHRVEAQIKAIQSVTEPPPGPSPNLSPVRPGGAVG